MQKARAFFYVCAGVFLLAMSWHLGARYARAQGATSSSQEVAMLSGEITDGGTIPLPHYRDGTEALESECQWIVSAQTIHPESWLRCSTTGRTVRVYGCWENCGQVGDCIAPFPNCPGPAGGTANCLIIATRVDGAIPTQRATWGEIKARYR